MNWTNSAPCLIGALALLLLLLIMATMFEKDLPEMLKVHYKFYGPIAALVFLQVYIFTVVLKGE